MMVMLLTTKQKIGSKVRKPQQKQQDKNNKGQWHM
jgi:hypothetical protein